MLPQRIDIREVGVREGAQFHKSAIPAQEKIRLIDLLSDCGFGAIEVASFVSPKALPQMADAEEVVSRIKMRPGTIYTAICLNRAGLARAKATGRLTIDGLVLLYSSDAFARKNVNRSVAELMDEIPNHIAMLESFGIKECVVSVSAAFGCNFSGDVAPQHVVDLIDRAMSIAAEAGGGTREIILGDTMGWATPRAVKHLVDLVQSRWPGIPIRLHLHDTHGLGIANAYAGMEMGVTLFDAAVGGLGGCPFSGSRGAAGNIVSEDLVHLCNELGVETGIDFEKLLDAACEAERIFKRELPGRNMHAGSLQSYRAAARETAGGIGLAEAGR
ncbi:hydroxymethylglutaryl-CoA lyase [Ramlibacter sp.]|uniref:hydroxymethylglutaryl-CoA lyase n=1 Tax=Ramlibacter sp. TaxID=1917967 RepID=UPI003D134F64